MASYYYLISSLPDLTSAGTMPVTYAEFLQMCKNNVNESTYSILENLTLASSEGPVVEEWAQRYHSLQGEINTQRSQKIGRSYNTSFEKDDVMAQIAASALGAKNPLEAEKILLDYEFELLDSLVGMHSFDDEYLFGYAIKLKLLERQSCFETEKGKAEFKHLFDTVQQRVYNL